MFLPGGVCGQLDAVTLELDEMIKRLDFVVLYGRYVRSTVCSLLAIPYWLFLLSSYQSNFSFCHFPFRLASAGN